MIDQTTRESSPGQVGMALLRTVTSPAWLRQPDYDFSVFKQGERRGILDHRAFAFNWQADKIEAGLHKYDKNSAYLAAAGGALLGVGAPIYQEAPTLDTKRPGLWLVHIEGAPGGAAALPPIIEDNQADSWQYTPVLQLLQERGYKLRIEAAYLWTEAHQVLRPFYERLKAMRQAAAGDRAALDRVKKIYTKTLGLLAYEPDKAGPGFLFRPDWWFCLVALSRAVTYRQMERVYQQEGAAPVAVCSDALYYRAPVQGLAIGPDIGQYKHQLVTPEESQKIKGAEDATEA